MARGGGLALAALALDALRGALRPAPAVARTIAPALSRGVWTRARIAIDNPSRYSLSLRLYDHHPATMRSEGLPLALAIGPAQRAELEYRLRPELRGAHEFGPVELRLGSPWKLFERHLRAGAPARVLVYPNLRALARYEMLAAQSRTAALGIKKRPRRGDGLEFHQLREYRAGDALRQIDWKATARLRKVISRE